MRRPSSRREVNGGPLLENVREGKDVDIEKIPTPVWHEQDGGPFIGTACMVVMKDPDSGWINYGAYRVQSQGPDVATVMMSPGKHGRIIMGKYHARKQPCPVAVVGGMHPGAVHAGGPRDPLRQERVRGGRRASSASRSRSSTCRAPGCRCPPMPRSPSKATSIPATSSRRGRSANGPATTPAAAGRSPRSASPP